LNGHRDGGEEGSFSLSAAVSFSLSLSQHSLAALSLLLARRENQQRRTNRLDEREEES